MTTLLQQASTVFVHESYSEANAFMYEACYLIGYKQTSVLVFDKSSKECRLLRHYPCPIQNLSHAEILQVNETLNQIPETDLKFSRFNVLIDHAQHTLVPDVFFEKEQADVLYSQTNEQQDTEELHVLKMPAFQSVLLFPFHKYLSTLLNSRLRSPRFIHQSAALLYGASKLFTAGQGLLLHYNGNFASIIYMKNKVPFFVNSFVAETDNDALYFLLATMEEFSIPPTFPVNLSGSFDDEESLLSLFRKYLHNVQWVPADLPVANGHHHFLLLSAALCE